MKTGVLELFVIHQNKVRRVYGMIMDLSHSIHAWFPVAYAFLIIL